MNPAQKAEIAIQEKSKRNESTNLDADVLNIIHVEPEFVPRPLKKLFFHDEKALRDEEIGRRIYLVLNNVPCPLIKGVQRDRIRSPS